MKLVIATAAFALTAVSAAYAAPGYATDTISTRNVPAAVYQDAQERAQNPVDTLSVTIGREIVADAADYLTARERNLHEGDTVSLNTFETASASHSHPLR